MYGDGVSPCVVGTSNNVMVAYGMSPLIVVAPFQYTGSIHSTNCPAKQDAMVYPGLGPRPVVRFMRRTT